MVLKIICKRLEFLGIAWRKTQHFRCTILAWRLIEWCSSDSWDPCGVSVAICFSFYVSYLFYYVYHPFIIISGTLLTVNAKLPSLTFLATFQVAWSNAVEQKRLNKPIQQKKLISHQSTEHNWANSHWTDTLLNIWTQNNWIVNISRILNILTLPCLMTPETVHVSISVDRWINIEHF